MPTPPVLPPAADSASLAWRPFLLLWLKIGALGFGGPAGQIALMHRELVEQRGWLDDARFLRALNFCMLLPGPEAQQLATWCGWRLKGTRGGLAAGLLFVLPGALVLALLTGLYLSVGNVAGVRAALFGVQAVVLALVALALSRVAAKALRDRLAWALAIMAFVLLFFLPFPFLSWCWRQAWRAGCSGRGCRRNPFRTAAIGGGPRAPRCSGRACGQPRLPDSRCGWALPMA